MKNTCRLCGGKLKNGICTECGMDNRKSDRMYRDRLNRSQYDHGTMESMSHVHTEQGVKPYKQPALNENKVPGKTRGKNPAQDQKKVSNQQTGSSAGKQPRKTAPYRSTDFKNIRNFSSPSDRRKKRSGIWIFFLVFIIIALSVGMSVRDFARNAPTGEETGDYSYDYNYDYDEETEDQLSEMGEYWNSDLPAGMYMVGIDIPEGEYTVTGSEGSSFEVHDKTHSIYRQESFGTEEYEIEQAEGIPLFTGALVCVDGMNPVSFVSENAQTQDLEKRTANPVTEAIDVSGTMTAGTDFPAGTYDIEAVGEDFGYITYEVPYEDSYSEGEQSYYSFGVMMEKNPTSEYPAYCPVYKNVVLPEGAVVDTKEYSCRLVPSSGIVSEDYEGFYDNMY